MFEKIILVLIGLITSIITATIVAFLCGWLVAIIWNASVVALFHFPEIDWWMGTKLMWLAGLLFHSSGTKD